MLTVFAMIRRCADLHVFAKLFHYCARGHEEICLRYEGDTLHNQAFGKHNGHWERGLRSGKNSARGFLPTLASPVTQVAADLRQGAERAAPLVFSGRARSRASYYPSWRCLGREEEACRDTACKAAIPYSIGRWNVVRTFHRTIGEFVGRNGRWNALEGRWKFVGTMPRQLSLSFWMAPQFPRRRLFYRAKVAPLRP
jgi:hypothetical protein